MELGTLLNSEAFQVWSTALTIMLVIIWLVNMLLTLKGAVTGKLLGLSHGWRRHPVSEVNGNV